MAVIETWFEQDLQKPVKVRYIDGNLFSHNGNGNRIGVIVTNNGEAVTLTGTVSGYAVLADGTTVPCTGTRSGNKASILVPAAAYSPGSILISIFLTDGTTVTTLAALSSSVIMARTGNQIDPGSVVTDWTNTINAAMQSVETAAANLGNIIATPYANLTFPVPLGAYTIYNNGLYRCISPIASSEAWTAAHWTNVKLGDDVANLKSTTINYSIPLYSGDYVLTPDMIIRGGTTTDGEPTSATTVIRNRGLFLLPKGSRFIQTPGTKCAKIRAVQFTLDRQLIKGIGQWITTEQEYTSDIDSLYVFMFQSNSGELLPSDYDGIIKIITKNYKDVTNLLAEYNNKKQQNAVAYVSGNSISWAFSGYQNSICSLTLGNNANIRFNTGVSDPNVVISKSDILTAVSGLSGITIDGDTITGNSFCIYYDFDSNTVKASKPTDVACFKNTCILFLHHFASVTSGELVRSVLTIKTIDNALALSNLNDRVSALEGSDVPSYLENNVTTVISELISNCTEKSFVIVFTTDNHYGASNGMNFPQTVATIRAINEKYPVDIVINGGDAINGDEVKATDISRIQEVVGSLRAVNGYAYTLVGNHDDGSFTAQTTPLLSEGELYSLFGRHMTMISDFLNNEKVYGYKDFDSVGIRLIFLDSRINTGADGATPATWGYDADQIAWLTADALNTNNQVIIFSHMGVTQEYSVGNIQPVNGVQVRNAIESFIANGGVVIGLFHGHTHWDFIGQYSQTNGFKEVSTGCGRVVSGPYPSGLYFPTGADMPIREAGTATQELYDVIVIKPKSRKVNMIRFGAGNNRNFDY